MIYEAHSMVLIVKEYSNTNKV